MRVGGKYLLFAVAGLFVLAGLAIAAGNAVGFAVRSASLERDWRARLALAA